MLLHQASGFLSILSFLALIFDDRLTAAIVASGQLFGLITGLNISAKRKHLWAVSTFGSGISILLFAVNRPSIVGLFCAFSYFFCIGLNLAFLPWLLPFEAFPEAVRPRAVAVLSTAHWLFGSVVGVAYFLFLRYSGLDMALLSSCVVLALGGGLGVIGFSRSMDPVAAAVCSQADDPVPGFAPVLVDLSE
jgi:hypothetical protein